MEKKRRISILLIVIGAICAIVATMMKSGADGHVADWYWVPIAVGALPLLIGIFMWIDD